MEVAPGSLSPQQPGDGGIVAQLHELPFWIHRAGAELPLVDAYEWHTLNSRDLIVIAGGRWFHGKR